LNRRCNLLSWQKLISNVHCSLLVHYFFVLWSNEALLFFMSVVLVTWVDLATNTRGQGKEKGREKGRREEGGREEGGGRRERRRRMDTLKDCLDHQEPRSRDKDFREVQMTQSLLADPGC
jgi:hypothetical protein